MKKTTFFTITAIIILIMVGYFVHQMGSMQAMWCQPYFNFACEAQAQLTCAGQGMFFVGCIAAAGECNGYTCEALFLISCRKDELGDWVYNTIACNDYFCSDCFPQN